MIHGWKVMRNDNVHLFHIFLVVNKCYLSIFLILVLKSWIYVTKLSSNTKFLVQHILNITQPHAGKISRPCHGRETLWKLKYLIFNELLFDFFNFSFLENKLDNYDLSWLYLELKSTTSGTKFSAIGLKLQKLWCF